MEGREGMERRMKWWREEKREMEKGLIREWRRMWWREGKEWNGGGGGGGKKRGRRRKD